MLLAEERDEELSLFCSSDSSANASGRIFKPSVSSTDRSAVDRVRTTHPRFSTVMIVLDIVGMLTRGWVPAHSDVIL